MACGSNVLYVNIDRPIRVRNKPGAVAHAVSIDRIRYEVIMRVAHGERPECIVRRKSSWREVHDVVVRPGELLASAILVRRPVHRLLRHVYRSGEYDTTRAAQENAVAWLAAPVDGGPTVDLRDIGVCENPEGDECQYAADDDALHDVRDDAPPPQEGEQFGNAATILRATELICICNDSITAHCLLLGQNLFDPTCRPLKVWI